MKVLIVGAGMQGQVITWNLGRNPAVTEIVVADYDEARAKFVAGQVGAGKAAARRSSTLPMSTRSPSSARAPS